MPKAKKNKQTNDTILKKPPRQTEGQTDPILEDPLATAGGPIR